DNRHFTAQASLRHGIGSQAVARADRIAGGVVGGVLAVVLIWFLLPAASEVPGGVAREVRSSTIASAIDELAPTPPNAARGLRTLIASTRFPEVVGDLGPTPATVDPPEQASVADAVIDTATDATVRVSARGCDRRYEGSGVTVAPDTIVTNAHVVAGAEEVRLTSPDGNQHDADVVVYDPERDLAVLEADGLGQQPLELGRAEAGSEGVSIGYPGGTTTPRVAPVTISERRTAVGRDIYGVEETEREVLFLAASLEQGDSGSPVVDADGQVVGIVFAVSPDRDTAAFALDRTEVDAVLDAPRVTGATGACIE
ncbi:MAG: trypsin-like peptidase domain-containing protein, partial [Actinomycetota bacterium]